jgi:ribonuclease HI
MLRKQGWKLLTNHDTILSQVFKAKYYPHEGFLDAKLGHNPSYVWRSIHASQVVVRKGLRWRIGSGTDVCVWNQPWLRNDEQPFITSDIVAGKEYMKVADLIDHSTGTWNHKLLHQTFHQCDVDEIVKIPTNLLHTDDERIWNSSRNGIYSVRSAYYLLTQVIIETDHLRVEGNWKKLWKLTVPHKVKLFLWRALRGCLPVRSRLIQRGVQCNNKCPHCEQTEENEWHCFFGCNTVQVVWQETEYGELLQSFIENAHGFVDMIFKLLDKIDSDKMAKITMILWTLWWRRNQKCWHDKVPTIVEVLRRAKDTHQSWMYAQRQHKNAGSYSPAAATCNWSKPPKGKIKCNVDTACYTQENSYCVGVCSRDEHGRFMKAYTKHFNGTPSVAEAEAMGVKEALVWLRHTYREQPAMELESDCLNVVQAINARHWNNKTEFGSIISVCRDLLVLNNNCKVSYVQRQANRVAHELAQATRFIASPQIYNYCPPCIESIIMNEMN